MRDIDSNERSRYKAKTGSHSASREKMKKQVRKASKEDQRSYGAPQPQFSDRYTRTCLFTQKGKNASVAREHLA